MTIRLALKYKLADIDAIEENRHAVRDVSDALKHNAERGRRRSGRRQMMKCQCLIDRLSGDDCAKEVFFIAVAQRGEVDGTIPPLDCVVKASLERGMSRSPVVEIRSPAACRGRGSRSSDRRNVESMPLP